MMNRLLRRSLVALLIWVLMVGLGGWMLEVRHCGHTGCADGIDDPALGILMMLLAMTSFVVVATGLAIYQALMWLQSR